MHRQWYQRLFKKYRLVAKMETPSISPLKIPAKIKPNIKGSGNLSQIENWTVKVILGNSVGGDEPNKGGWGKVGYVFINPKTKEFIPIARSDEHHSGWDLMNHYKRKGLVKSFDGFVPIFSVRHTYVFEYEDSDVGPDTFKEAFKLWRGAGGKNLAVEFMTTRSWDKNMYAGNMDDFIEGGHLKVGKKGFIHAPARELIELLEKAAKEFNQMRKTGKESSRIWEYAKAIVNIFSSHMRGILGLYKENDYLGLSEVKDQLEKLETKNDLKGLEDLLFGFKGIKNSEHQLLRQMVKESDKKDSMRDSEKKFYGDIEAALKEFERLGNI